MPTWVFIVGELLGVLLFIFAQKASDANKALYGQMDQLGDRALSNFPEGLKRRSLPGGKWGIRAIALFFMVIFGVIWFLSR